MFDKGENTYLKELTSLDIVLDNVADRIFDNNINYLSEQARVAYDSMRYMDVIKYAFYEMNVILFYKILKLEC